MTKQKELHSSRCLLTALVNRLKGNLKRVRFLICLTPFACRSGQTSSMLGGAQFKATLLNQKALVSNIQCKMTDSDACPEMESSFLQLLILTGVCPYLLTSLHRGRSGQKMHNAAGSHQSHKAPELSVYACVNWFSTVSLKPKSMPYAHAAQQR